ncbi:ribosomal protein S5 domain 2-like protein [Polychaeton citri CBS 116435]|uniref:Elongation factor 2 n=1 Tax=Polychaeton citri CBS 116435 TaxID=1314669 RepID=A0A9P4Q244_9PEZI|nr:ribosomal protein S5 domain 2-like protein [Polychaeton citri CBS 116435]
MSANAIATGHIWRQAVEPTEPGDRAKVQAALDDLIAAGTSTSIWAKEREAFLYITAKTEPELNETLEALKIKAGVQITADKPIPIYLESVLGSCEESLTTKSPNKANRVYVTAEPIDSGIVDLLEDPTTTQADMQDLKKRLSVFASKLNMRDDWIKKILCFGPNGLGPNVLVDQTKGIAYLNEVKDSLNQGFQEATSRGPVIEEPVHGLRVNLADLVLHADAAQRSLAQMLVPLVNAVKATILYSEPCILEPVYFVNATLPQDMSASLYNIITTRRGDIQGVEDEGKFSKYEVTLPAAEAVSFEKDLSQVVKNPKLTFKFGYYAQVPGQLDDKATRAGSLVAEIRRSKGLHAELNSYTDYASK